MSDEAARVMQVLQSFQDGYSTRDIDKLDHFMELFSPAEDIELIGIGASARNGYEWFQGPERIREIIESDWKYWGDVRLDVAGGGTPACSAARCSPAAGRRRRPGPPP